MAHFTQVLDPLHSLVGTTLLALVPIALLLILLAVLRMNALLNDLIAKEVGENACELLSKALGPIASK